MPSAFRACALSGWSLTKARVRPSANCTRRRISSSSAGISFSAMSARTGWPGGSSKAAVTWPCSAPWRTNATSPRAPSARAKASSRMDLPAPVSPVSTDRPETNSISSRSMRIMSRIESRASMTTVLAFRWAADAEAYGLPVAARPQSKDGTWRSGVVSLPRRNSGSPRTARHRRRKLGGADLQCQARARAIRGKRLRRGDLEFQLRECLADPVAFALVGLHAPRLHQRISVLVPAAFGEVVAEHGSRSLRLLDDPERQIDLREPQEGFLDVTRPLVARHHHLEAIDGAYVIVRVLQLTPNIHFLAGQLIARNLDLALGGDGIFGLGIFADHLFERLDRLVGALLVAGDFRHLIEIGRADEELRVGGIGASRMQRDVAAGRIDAVVIGVGLVIGEGRHDQRLARPFRIGVLAVDLFELLGRGLGILLGVQKVEALVVELVGRLVGSDGVLVEQAAGAERERHQRKGQKPRRCTRAAFNADGD